MSPQEMSPQDLVDRASDELRTLVLSHQTDACETIFERFPELHSHPDGILEIIYLEYVLRQEANPTEDAASLVSEYTQRFPEYADDIVKLLEVNQAFSSLGLTSSGSHSSPGQLHALGRMDWDAPIGRIGEYQLQEVLGQGGMGVVYRAVQARLGRDVAIKTIAAERVDGAAIARFQKEAELASSLQHPNIAQIYEVGMHCEVPFYSMEYVSGGSLAQFLHDQPLRPDLSARLVAVLGRAIDHAHSRGIIHRDLKPANILLSPSTRPEALELPDARPLAEGKASGELVERYEPKIVDFGLAIQISSKQDATHASAGRSVSAKGPAIGTPSYMAPEQIEAALGAIGPETDVYALGAILYHALVGRPPFYAASSHETLRQVLHEEPVPPRRLQPRISGDLETICLKCLKKSPATRYASANELANDLQRYLDGKPIQARPAAYPERAYKWAIRHPSLMALIAAMTVAIMLTTWLWRRSEESLNAELAQRQRNEQLNYDRNIGLAHLEYQSHNVDGASALLEQCDPRFRNWEWQYVRNLCNEPFWQCSSGDSDRLVDASLSADGRLIATCHGVWGKNIEQRIYVWDAISNRLLWKLRGHADGMGAAVDFHPDGKRLLSSSFVWGSSRNTGAVLEWDIETGQLLRTIANANALAAHYSHDGTRIYVGEASGVVRIYDTDTGKELRRCKRHNGLVLSICESENGKLLATSARDGTIAIWDIESGKEVTSLGNMGDPRQIVWSTDMTQVLVCGFGGQVDTFRWEGNRLVHAHRTSERHTQISRFSPDGRMHACAAYGEGATLKDTDNGWVMREFHGHRGQVRALDFDRTGRWLLTAGTDGTCRLWDVMRRDGYFKKTLSSEGSIKAITFRPSQAEFAIAMGVQITKPVSDSGKPRIEVWDAHRQRLKRTLWGHSDWVSAVAYSPSGQKIISGSLDKTVRVWDAENGKSLAILKGHDSSLIFVAMLSDQQAISVDSEGTLKHWDLTFKRETASSSLLGPEDPTSTSLKCVAFQADNNWIAVAIDLQVRIHNLSDRKLIATLPLKAEANEIEFSPDAKKLAVASAAPDILVFDVTKIDNAGKCTNPMVLTGHHEQVNSIAFGPDSRRLASVGYHEAIRFFELELGNELLKLEDGPGVQSLVAFADNGQHLIRCDGQQLYNYSLVRIDKRFDVPDDQAIIQWHQESYKASIDRLQSFAAAFHCRRLIELQPEVKLHVVHLANRLTDQGDLHSAQELLESVEFSEPSEELERLSGLICVALLKGDDKSYQRSLQAALEPVHQLNKLNGWNNYVWYASLRAGQVEGFDEFVRKIESSTKGLKSHVYHNTLALAYYRQGKYVKSLDAVGKSLADKPPMPPPLDFIIRGMCQSQMLIKQQQTLAASQADATSGAEDQAGVLELEKQSLATKIRQLQDTLKLVDTWCARGEEQRYTVKKLTHQQMQIQQLDFPLLLEELKVLVKATGHPFEFEAAEKDSLLRATPPAYSPHALGQPAL